MGDFARSIDCNLFSGERRSMGPPSASVGSSVLSR